VAHADLHRAIVAASGSPRIIDHAQLIEDLERDGSGVLREHLRSAAETLAGEGDRPGG
jgi:hypothetical protein